MNFDELCRRVESNDPGLVTVDACASCQHCGFSNDHAVKLALALRRNTYVQRMVLEASQLGFGAVHELGTAIGVSRSLQALELRVDVGRFPSTEALDELFCDLHTSCVECLSLRGLHMVQCAESFPRLLTKMKSLVEIQLIDCHLGPVDSESIERAFRDVDARTVVVNQVDPYLLVPLLQGLRYNKNLQSFSLQLPQHRRLREAASQLKVFLVDSPSLREFSLVGWSEGSIASVTDALRQNPLIEKVSFTSCGLSCDDMSLLGYVLQRPNAGVETLALCDDIGIGNEGFGILASCLSGNTRVHSLHASGIGLTGSKGAKIIMELLSRDSSITTLKTGITLGMQDESTLIAQGLASNDKLLDLELCFSYNLDVDRVAASLGRGARIQRLSLRGGRIRHQSLCALTCRLNAINCQELDLSYKHLSDSDAGLLAGCLRSSAAGIRKLNLDVNNIGDEGATAIFAALESNTSLSDLSLVNNPMRSRSYQALARSLPGIHGLQKISFSWTETNEPALEGLLKGFRKNSSLIDNGIIVTCGTGVWLRHVEFFQQRNRFFPLLNTTDGRDIPAGLWPHMLSWLGERNRESMMYAALAKTVPLVLAESRGIDAIDD